MTGGNGVIVEFPANTFSQTVVVTLTALSNTEVPTAGTFGLLGMAFDLHAVDAQTGLSVQPVAGMSYTVSVPYDENALGGIDESSLRLYYWNRQAWIVEPNTTVDTAKNLLYAKITHFSIWALGSNSRIYIPIVVKRR
jgi:hypothetical protein